MNIKDMEITFERDIPSRRLIVKYKKTPIAEASLVDKNSLFDIPKNRECFELTFSFRDGRTVMHDIAKYVVPDLPYLDQFGISVTEDGTHFFIQSWENGLFCFDMLSGELKWHHKKKKASHLIILHDVVVCQHRTECVVSLDLLTGAVRKRIPLSWDSTFLAVNDNRYLIGPKRGKHQIIDEYFNIITSIPCKDFNPNNFRTFIILEVNPAPNGIEICGFEYTETDGNNMDKHRFSRIVPCNLRQGTVLCPDGK